MKRWRRAKRDEELLQIGSICYERGLSFVTLTQPNMVGDVLENIRLFKKDVACFRKRFPRDCISGGKDFYEFTIHPDDRAWSTPLVQNVHMHGVWIMDYWNQKDFQDSWGHGIAHLFRVKEGESPIRYVTKYCTKDDVRGVRTKEGFGCLYGRAKRAMLSAWEVRQTEEL